MLLSWSLSNCIYSLLILFWQTLVKIQPLLVMIVSMFALYIAILSKREARIAAKMNLFYQHMARYSSSEMHNALEIIGTLFDKRKEKEGVFLQVVRRFQNKDNIQNVFWEEGGKTTKNYHFGFQYEEINHARRYVSHFFTSSFDLFTDFKVLNDAYFKKICSIDTFKFLYYVVEWLELALNPNYAREKFTCLLEQSGRNDIEDLRKHRPPKTWGEVEKMIKSSLAEKLS